MAKTIVASDVEKAFDLVHDKLKQLTMIVGSNMEEYDENLSSMARLEAKGIVLSTQLYEQSPKKFLKTLEGIKRGHEHRRLTERQKIIWSQTVRVMRHVDRLLEQIKEGV